MRSLSSVLKVNGTIDLPPQNVVSISAPSGGYVKSSDLLPGQLVRKGRVMVVIENAKDFCYRYSPLQRRTAKEELQ